MKKIVEMYSEKKNDWCHLCGDRKEMVFVSFDVPENAEHSFYNDGSRGFHRFCEDCINALSICVGNHK